MFWQQRPNPTNWIDQIRYFTDHSNKLSEDELRDAFINLAYLFVTEHTNVRLLEDGIMEALGDKGEQFIQYATTETDRAKELMAIGISLESRSTRWIILKTTGHKARYIQTSKKGAGLRLGSSCSF